VTRLVCLADVPRVPPLGLHTQGHDVIRPVTIDPKRRRALDRLLSEADQVIASTPAGSQPRLLVLVDGHDRRRVVGALQGLVRAARDIDVVTITSTLPPLGIAVLAEQLAVVMAARDDDGVTLTALPALVDDLSAYAWLGSVGGLAHLPTAVSQHLRSWVPGMAFFARATGEPMVVPTQQRSALEALPQGPGRGAVVSVSPKGDDTWIRTVALPRLSPEVLLTAEPPPPPSTRSGRDAVPTDPGRRWWGTAKAVELVSFGLDPLAIVSGVAPHRSCTWCGRPTASQVCPLCGMSALSSARA
jgi:hypothetical protein